MKQRRFRLHFNRPAMQRGQPHVWSVRLSDRCLHASDVKVKVPLATEFRPHQKQNPRAFFTGRGVVRQDGDSIVITAA